MTDPVIAQKGPYVVTVEEGKSYFWCACGRSKDQPFCDGSHEVTDLRPIRWKADASGEKYFCGCKHTKTPPFCDGTHETL
ncbi:CDGSH-type Zn-finger protein [Rhodobium orientis]|uniref:Glutamate synthase n=1 Tax=Rhodobium orientis TaxID=34017 RepID=A0A327JGB5_9HYPH|nr:CDGSH iron-sulfur domain-containing protein [Rhodobium orientis]MBB4305497.1 CDGSH-type Zn-finger protein [Rhodobium orientis]MBK5949863.1 glutamate synthase [Rhodobium orientis]RAI24736.1 glutamate synthase [Rhodobium orientis]